MIGGWDNLGLGFSTFNWKLLFTNDLKSRHYDSHTATLSKTTTSDDYS